MKHEQPQQENEVENREFEQISADVFGIQRGIFAESYERSKRGDERACAADINTEQKLAVIFRKIGKEYGRGNVAYKLA